MSDSSNQQSMPEKVVELMVDNIFRKNGVKPEDLKNNLSQDQRQMLKDMVDDLRKQVDQFNKGEKNTNKTSE